MSTFVDFAKLKQRVSIEQVVQMLGLNIKHAGEQWRGPCPPARPEVTRTRGQYGKQSFYCFPVVAVVTSSAS